MQLKHSLTSSSHVTLKVHAHISPNRLLAFMGLHSWNTNSSGQGSVAYMQLTAVLDVAQEDVVVLATVAAGAVAVEAKEEEQMQAS